MNASPVSCKPSASSETLAAVPFIFIVPGFTPPIVDPTGRLKPSPSLVMCELPMCRDPDET